MDVHSQRTVSGEQVQSGRFVWLPWLIGKHNSYQGRLHWPDPCSIVHLHWWLQLTQCQYCNIATHVPYAEWQKRTSASLSGEMMTRCKTDMQFYVCSRHYITLIITCILCRWMDECECEWLDWWKDHHRQTPCRMFSNLTTITTRVCANNILLGCTRLSVRQHRRMCMDTEKKQEDRVAESLCVLSDGRISLLDYLYFLPPHKQNKAIDKFLFGGYILISQITACTDQVGIIRAIP